jgi:hypothetical protein
MSKQRARLHLPFNQWPQADQHLWQQVTSSADPFSEAAGASLAVTSKTQYLFAWRRFLGFLSIDDQSALDLPASERLTQARIRSFTDHLAKTHIPRSVAIQIDALYKAARVMMPELDLSWLKLMKARLHSAAPLKRASGPSSPASKSSGSDSGCWTTTIPKQRMGSLLHKPSATVMVC